jgi:hypothetical protein
MSQLGHFQRNDYLGDINNFDGTSVAGAVVNSGGGDIFIGSHPARKGESGLLEREGTGVLSLGMYTRIYAAKISLFLHSLHHRRS